MFLRSNVIHQHGWLWGLLIGTLILMGLMIVRMVLVSRQVHEVAKRLNAVEGKITALEVRTTSVPCEVSTSSACVVTLADRRVSYFLSPGKGFETGNLRTITKQNDREAVSERQYSLPSGLTYTATVTPTGSPVGRMWVDDTQHVQIEVYSTAANGSLDEAERLPIMIRLLNTE